MHRNIRTAALAITVAGLAASLVGNAMAADLAVYAEPAPVAPGFDWTGFYIGAHGGYGGGRAHDDQSDNFPECDPGTGGGGTFADAFDLKGFTGGVHAGYNHQLSDNFVVGVEGDLEMTGLKGSADGVYPGCVGDDFARDANPGDRVRTLELKSDWQGSARFRAGFAVDNLLFYGTAGVAFARGTLTNSGGTVGSGGIATTSDSQTHVGWTAGLGAEYAFTDNVIGRTEVRYSKFGDESYSTADGDVDAGWDQTVATVGLSFKF